MILELRKIIDEYKDKVIENGYESPEYRFLCEDPLAPVIATICDWRIRAEVAWSIPYHLSLWLRRQGYEFKASSIVAIGEEGIRRFLEEFMKEKSRWPRILSQKNREEWINLNSKWIVEACKIIVEEYNDDPDNIFVELIKLFRGLSPPLIYLALRRFPGIGAKKASMISRDIGLGIWVWYEGLKKRLRKRSVSFDVQYKMLTEIPIDVHIKRIFTRVFKGFIETKIRRKEFYMDVQNLAKAIYPEASGLVDLVFWNIARDYCKPKNPKCIECPLSKVCITANTLKQ